MPLGLAGGNTPWRKSNLGSHLGALLFYHDEAPQAEPGWGGPKRGAAVNCRRIFLTNLGTTQCDEKCDETGNLSRGR